MKLPAGLWVRLSLGATLIWLVASVYDIAGSDAPLQGKINLAIIAILVAVAIIGVGLGVQWAVDYIRDSRER